MKKEVIGFHKSNYLRALIATLIGVVCLFLPYMEKKVNRKWEEHFLFEIIGKAAGKSGVAVVMCLLVVFTVISLILAMINFFQPSKKLAGVWIVSHAVIAVCYTILLFATKSVADLIQIYDGDFMVKNFSFGYILGLLAAYYGLGNVMKTINISTGYIVLTLLGVVWMFPILWIILTALRAEQGFYVGYFIPKGFTFNNFVKLFTNGRVLPFGRWYLNTFIVAAVGCVVNTLIILGVAFVLSRTRFNGRVSFMKALLIIGMFPSFMSMLAVYNILKGINLNQSLVALIIVGAANAAMGYHVSKGFFDTIPFAVDEAAIIDGATRFQIFTKVTLPLSKSIIIYTVLMNFVGPWSDYIFPSMLFGDKQSNYTVAVGLYWMTDFRRIETYYTQFAAGALVVAIPIVILFIWLQKFYVDSLSGAVKG